MSELAKTSVYVGAAIVLAIAAYVSRPRQAEFQINESIGQPLFPDFQDPADASRLEIVRFDQELGELHAFEVRKQKLRGESGAYRWVIPTHSDYPADAESQMKDAANALIGLDVLGIASEIEADHELFGVVEPDKDQLKVGDVGVGLKVAIEDNKGKSLARLIIGKKVKDAEDQRFVRVPGQTPVYTVNIDPEKLSTKFEDWIEKDLLKLSTWDIRELQLKDYSVLRTSTGGFGIDRRFDVTVEWDSDKSEWNLKEMATYRNRNRSVVPLAENEEINTSKLNDLKYALDDLDIVDVRRKPKGLGADLKADRDFMKNQEGLDSLYDRGFIPLRFESGEPELFAANGEVLVGMKNGLEYVLRFGNVASAETTGEESKLNRYLFLTARFNESRIPPPELEELPKEEPTEETPAEKTDEKPTEAQDGKAEESDQPGNDEKAAEDEPAKKENQTNSDAGSEDKAPADADAEKNADAEEEKTDSDQQADDKQTDETGDEKTDSDQQADDSQTEEPGGQEEDLDAQRERIRKENKRKQDEYDDKVKEGKRQAVELNAGFADWYYIISEDVFKKMHLSRADIIKETESSEKEGSGIDAFRTLEKEGLEGGEESSDEEDKNN